MDMPSFDEMVRLAKNDPETLERIRLKLIEETIAEAPENCHRRLRGLQFQIGERRELLDKLGRINRSQRILISDLRGEKIQKGIELL